MMALRLWTGSTIFGRKVKIGDAYREFFLPADALPLAYVLVQKARGAF